MKQYILTLLAILSLLFYAAGGFAQTSAPTKEERKVQKQLQKEQRKQQRDEIRYYESLRNDAVVAFAKKHQPEVVYTPFIHHFNITDVACAGDNITGTVMLHFRISPLIDGFRIFMGGNRNGTRAYTDEDYYESDNLYGRIYTFRSGDSENVIITFRNVDRKTTKFNRINISMGLSLNILNQIVMTNVPIFWTESDETIRNYVKSAPIQGLKKD